MYPWSKLETPLEKAVANCYKELEELSPADDQYNKIVKNVELLERMQADIKAKRRPSADAILAAVVSIGGIVIIVLVEVYGHAIPTKLLSLLLKVKH